MKNLLIAAVVLVLLIAGLGFYQGWFEAGGKKEADKVQANLNINVDKFKHDKETFKKYLGEKSKALKDKLASLKDKSKSLTGDAKAKAEKEIESLDKKHEGLMARMKEVDESTEDKLEALKKTVSGEEDSDAAGSTAKDGRKSN
jgi:hypothetical protein